MSAQHTPGPWLVFPQWPDRFFVGDYNAGKGPYRTLVDCSPRRCIDGSGDHAPTEDECSANARLIAAAPELLAACLDLMLLCDGWKGKGKIREQARAAIAKATGSAA